MSNKRCSVSLVERWDDLTDLSQRKVEWTSYAHLRISFRVPAGYDSVTM